MIRAWAASVRAAADRLDWDFLGRMLPRATVFGLFVGWALTITTSRGLSTVSGGLGGDYPAFYAAGRIVLSGATDHLYDFATQRAFGAEFPNGGFLPFVYPPFVAALYAPLATFGYRTSFALFNLLSFFSLFASVRLLWPISPTIRRNSWLVLAGLFFFYPVLRGILGGQNTALSLLVVCGTWRLFYAERGVAAGLVLSVLSCKPQYLLPVVGAVFMARRFDAVLGVVCGMGVFYAAGAWISGWGWPIDWLGTARAFAVVDAQSNMANSVSLGQIPHLLGFPNGWIPMSLALSIWVAWVAWKGRRGDFVVVLGISQVAALLIAPHAMYYDLGIAAPAILLLADRGRPRAAAWLWLGSASQFFAQTLVLSPVILVLAILLLLLRRELHE